MDSDSDSSDDADQQPVEHTRRIEVVGADGVVTQLSGQNLANLPRELQNLGSDSRILVNHTYNIHYQSDRPSQQHRDDIEIYGHEYSRAINRRCLEICAKPDVNCMDLPCPPSCILSPVLHHVRYFCGNCGIPKTVRYTSDATYTNHTFRKFCGKKTDLKHLHEQTYSSSRPCLHVALVGNQGSGKTVLCKRYAKMVLDREVEELSTDVDFVHYVNVNDVYHDGIMPGPISEILFDRLVDAGTEQNLPKYGYEWICNYPERMLLIFDDADQALAKFKERFDPINISTKTILPTLIQNILDGRIFRGCRTLIAARDWAFKGMCGNCRPEKLILVGPMSPEDRVTLVKSISPSELEAEDYCNSLHRKFPAGFFLMRDAMYTYFAVSSLKWGEYQLNHKLNTDVMLVMCILQHLIRSSNVDKELAHRLWKFRAIAFDMISDGVISRTSPELTKYEELTYDDLLDMMVVAPQHKHHINYRLLVGDYSYFFANQVMQDTLAACHIGGMPFCEFERFADDHLHQESWLAVRRYVCGIMLNENIKPNATYFLNKSSDDRKKEEKLLSSLEDQAKKMESLPSFQRFELLASLQECGEAAKSIVEKYVRKLVLKDFILKPCHLHIISQIEPYIQQLQEVDICLDGEVDIKEFDQITSTAVKNGEKIRLDLSKLALTSSHVNGLERPLRKVKQMGKAVKLHVVACKETSSYAIKLLDNFSKGLCKLKLEKVDAVEMMDDS